MESPSPGRQEADTDLATIPSDWLADFEAAARRPLEVRLRYSFIRTYKPVLDDAPYRSFDTMEEYLQRTLAAAVSVLTRLGIRFHLTDGLIAGMLLDPEPFDARFVRARAERLRCLPILQELERIARLP